MLENVKNIDAVVQYSRQRRGCVEGAMYISLIEAVISGAGKNSKWQRIAHYPSSANLFFSYFPFTHCAIFFHFLVFFVAFFYTLIMLRFFAEFNFLFFFLFFYLCIVSTHHPSNIIVNINSSASIYLAIAAHKVPRWLQRNDLGNRHAKKN